MSTKPDQAQTDPSTAAPTARDEVEDLDPAIACDEDIRPPQNLVDDALLVGCGKPSASRKEWLPSVGSGEREKRDVLTRPHSSRKTRIGSVRAARIAGQADETVAMVPISSTTPRNVAASSGETP
jgi:hypothetical protein